MSRVDSEAYSVLASRPPLPNSRTYSDPASKDSSPFADLLDSQVPAAEPAPAPPPARSGRPDRADQSKPTDDRNSEAKTANDSTNTKPANNSADTKDAKAADNSDDAKSAKDAKDTKSADDAKDAKGTKGTKDAKDSKAAVGDKSKSDADQKATADAVVVAPATPAVVAPQPVAVAVVQPTALAAGTEGGKSEEEALAALQAASGHGPRVGPDATKPGQTQSGDKPADTGPKGIAAADPQTGVPAVESGKDGQTQSGGEKSFSEFHRAAAELLSKLEGQTPAPAGGDAASAAKAGTDAVQNLGVAAPASATNAATTTAAAAAPAQAQAPATPVPLSGLAVEIVTHADAGRNHFEIRLDPPDLGRINVKLHVDNDGNVTTHLMVDRPETLDLLKRDASSLERALQQAGLKTSDQGLDFSLRQHSFAQDDTPKQTSTQQMVVPEDDPAPLEALRQGYGRPLGLSGGLDIRV